MPSKYLNKSHTSSFCHKLNPFLSQQPNGSRLQTVRCSNRDTSCEAKATGPCLVSCCGSSVRQRKVTKTTGLFSSPGAVVLQGESEDVLQDAQTIRKVSGKKGGVLSRKEPQCLLAQSSPLNLLLLLFFFVCRCDSLYKCSAIRLQLFPPLRWKLPHMLRPRKSRASAQLPRNPRLVEHGQHSRTLLWRLAFNFFVVQAGLGKWRSC